MNLKTLEENLDKALQDFSSAIRSEYDDYNQSHATNADISTLARHTFYALEEFKKEIIIFLKNN